MIRALRTECAGRRTTRQIRRNLEFNKRCLYGANARGDRKEDCTYTTHVILRSERVCATEKRLHETR